MNIKEHLKFALKVLIAIAVINLVLGLINKFAGGTIGTTIANLRDNPLGAFPSSTASS